MTNMLKKIAMTSSLVAGGLLMADVANAASVGTLLQNAASANFTQTNTFVTGFMYVAGVIMGAAGVFKLRDHMKSPDHNPLKVPVGLLLAASLALALPSYLKTGVDTTFGQGNATMNTLNGSTL